MRGLKAPHYLNQPTGRGADIFARYAQRGRFASGKLTGVNTVTANPDLIAYCGLYCGACKAYLAGRCPGCRENTKAGWCKVRSCCIGAGRSTCAACPTHADPRTCGHYHNIVSRLFGLVFRSNRAGCIDRLRTVGAAAFAAEMAAAKRRSLPR